MALSIPSNHSLATSDGLSIWVHHCSLPLIQIDLQRNLEIEIRIKIKMMRRLFPAMLGTIILWFHRSMEVSTCSGWDNKGVSINCTSRPNSSWKSRHSVMTMDLSICPANTPPCLKLMLGRGNSSVNLIVVLPVRISEMISIPLQPQLLPVLVHFLMTTAETTTTTTMTKLMMMMMISSLKHLITAINDNININPTEIPFSPWSESIIPSMCSISMEIFVGISLSLKFKIPKSIVINIKEISLPLLRLKKEISFLPMLLTQTSFPLLMDHSISSIHHLRHYPQRNRVSRPAFFDFHPLFLMFFEDIMLNLSLKKSSSQHSSILLPQSPRLPLLSPKPN